MSHDAPHVTPLLSSTISCAPSGRALRSIDSGRAGPQTAPTVRWHVLVDRLALLHPHQETRHGWRSVEAHHHDRHQAHEAGTRFNFTSCRREPRRHHLTCGTLNLEEFYIYQHSVRFISALPTPPDARPSTGAPPHTASAPPERVVYRLKRQAVLSSLALFHPSFVLSRLPISSFRAATISAYSGLTCSTTLGLSTVRLTLPQRAYQFRSTFSHAER